MSAIVRVRVDELGPGDTVAFDSPADRYTDPWNVVDVRPYAPAGAPPWATRARIVRLRNPRGVVVESTLDRISYFDVVVPGT